MSDALRPPDGWTLYHSIALLLVGASVIDGELAPEEVTIIRERLGAYPELGAPQEVMALVVPYFETLRGTDSAMWALDKHARQLAKALSEDACKLVANDIIAVVGADGELHPNERDYVTSVCRHFGLELPP